MTVCDVTIREASQMPGRSYSVDQRVKAGHVLDELGIGMIQPGFPAIGSEDREAVRRLAEATTADICAIARVVEGDIDAAVEADADVIQVFAPVSDLQLKHVLGKSREELVSIASDAVEYAADRGPTVMFGMMDGFRADPHQVQHLYGSIPDADAYLLADTVGSRTPSEVTSFLTELDTTGVELDEFGVHFHDDVGLATANTREALRLGVGQIDVSVASLGERAGNAALEEVVVASVLEADDHLGIDTDRLIPSCRRVLEILNEEVPDRKPILGEQVFSHESGIHTATMLDAPETFEPFDPADFGSRRELIFGEGTGRAAATALLERAGRSPTDDRVKELLTLLVEEGPVGLDGALALAKEV